MLIAQLSDTHVAVPGTPFARRFRTPERLSRAVAHLLSLPQPPSAVVVSGDCVEGGTIEEYEVLRELLAPLPMPVHLVMGNHDNRDNLLSVFRDRMETHCAGFLQYAVRVGSLRLIVLDTQIPGEPGGELCDTRLEWLAEQLREEPDTPTLICLHHPPFPTGMPVMDAMGLSGGHKLGAVLDRFHQVERLLSGHIHRPSQFRFHGTIAQTCGSTAHQLKLHLGANRLALVDEPPACLLHYWDEAHGLVTHMSYIEDFGPPTLLLDDER